MFHCSLFVLIRCYDENVLEYIMIRMFDCCFYCIKGSGRAFCAGGDVVTLYKQINEGKEFFLIIGLVSVINDTEFLICQ